MTRVIDADKLAENFAVPSYETFSSSYILSCIKEAPTVDAEPVRHGKWSRLKGDWKSSKTGEPLTVHQCSACGNYFIHAPYRFCPECGAKMDGE